MGEIPPQNPHFPTTRDLLKKTSIFHWTDAHECTLRELIAIMVKLAPLTLFDPLRPLFLICDGSATGVGAISTHDVEQREIRLFSVHPES